MVAADETRLYMTNDHWPPLAPTPTLATHQTRGESRSITNNLTQYGCLLISTFACIFLIKTTILLDIYIVDIMLDWTGWIAPVFRDSRPHLEKKMTD